MIEPHLTKQEQRYAALVRQVARAAGLLMAALEEEEEEDEGVEPASATAALQLVRLRSANHEVVISPVGGYCLAVVTEAGAGACGAGAGGIGRE